VARILEDISQSGYTPDVKPVNRQISKIRHRKTTHLPAGDGFRAATTPFVPGARHRPLAPPPAGSTPRASSQRKTRHPTLPVVFAKTSMLECVG